MSSFVVKVLGTSIGAMGQAAEFDGDNDGLRTGPDGQDNIPYVKPPSAVQGVVGKLRKVFRSKKYQELEKKLGGLDILPVPKVAHKPGATINSKVNDDVIALAEVASQDKETIAMLKKLGFTKLAEDIENNGDTWKNAVEQARVESAADGRIKSNEVRSYLKARLTTQIAKDLRKLGVTDDDVRSMYKGLLEKHKQIMNSDGEPSYKRDVGWNILKQLNEMEKFLGLPPTWENPETGEIEPVPRQKLPQLFPASGRSFVPSDDLVANMANFLVGQWQRTSNDTAPMSMAIQAAASRLMPQLKNDVPLDNPKDFVHARVFGHDGEIADRIGGLILESPEAQKIVDGFIQSTYVRTQQHLESLGSDSVTVFRGEAEGSNVDLYRNAVDLDKAYLKQLDELREIDKKYEEALEKRDSIIRSKMDLRRTLTLSEEQDGYRSPSEQTKKLREMVEALAEKEAAATKEFYEISGDREALVKRMRIAKKEIAVDVEARLRPLSAWSSNGAVSENDFSGSDGVLITADVPIQNVWAIPVTGAGCLEENEFILATPTVDGVMSQSASAGENKARGRRLGKSARYVLSTKVGASAKKEKTKIVLDGDIQKVDWSKRSYFVGYSPEQIRAELGVYPSMSENAKRGIRALPLMRYAPDWLREEVGMFAKPPKKPLVKVLGTPIGSMSEVDGDGDGLVSGPGGDKYPAPPKKIVDGLNEILVPASNFAEANKNNRPWAPLLRDGWTPELRKQMDDAIDFEKRFAPIASAFLEKYRNRDDVHWLVNSMMDGAYIAFDANDKDKELSIFEDMFNALGDETKSKEAQDLLKFVRDNGVPVMVRHRTVKKWSDDYVNHVIEALKKDGVKETHPFYKKMLDYKKYENSPAHYPNPFGRWLSYRLMGTEKHGKIVQFMADIKREGAVPDANEVAKKLVGDTNRRIGIALAEDVLDKVLSDGKYKNLFENNGENAFVDKWLLERRDSQEKDKLRMQMEQRALAEQMLFGIPLAGRKKSARPVYGFFFEKGVENIGELDKVYGSLKIVMKRDVEKRATMTAGDSLAGQFLGVSPLNDPKGIGVQGGWNGSVNDKTPDYAMWGNHYHEAQILGGVSVDDIAYVAVPDGYKFANADLQKKLADLGISVQVLPKEGKFAEPGDLQGKADKQNSGVLVAVSGTKRLFEVENDSGYLLVRDERMDVPSVSAVLKFGYWDLVDSEEDNMKHLMVKVLGTPIGGVSDVDGDGDGFVTGPGGKDNVPVVVASIKKFDLDAVIQKLGKKVVSEPEGKIDLNAPKLRYMENKSQKMTYAVNGYGLSVIENAPNDTAVIDALKILDPNLAEEIQDKEKWSAVVKDVRSTVGWGDIKQIQHESARKYMKARIAVQTAADMRALGVTDEDARKVMSLLSFKSNSDDPVLEIAGRLVTSWAISANGNNLASLLVQRNAEKRVRDITGDTQDFVGAQIFEDVEIEYQGETGLARNILDKLMSEPAMRKVLDAQFDATYARTQQMLKDSGIDEVDLYRGVSKQGYDKVEGLLKDVQQYYTIERDLKYVRSYLQQLENMSDEEFADLQSDYAIRAGKNTRLEAIGANKQRFKELQNQESKLMQEKFDNDSAWIEYAEKTAIVEDEARMRPLSSWAVDLSRAIDFMENVPQGVLMGAKVPRSRVYSTALTGPGALFEAEFIVASPTMKVVLGRLYSATALRFKMEGLEFPKPGEDE